MSEYKGKVIELPRQPDGEAFYLHFAGGFRAAKAAKDVWRIEPVLIDKKPCATGFLTTAQLQALTKRNQFQAIAFHRFGWQNGTYFSSWTPIIPGQANHFEGAVDLWRSISSNIARVRTAEFFDRAAQPRESEIADALDAREPVEALAQSISLSLRSMDINVEQIAEHYHEQLVNHMITGNVDGQRSSNTQAQTLFAHVHSFFLHLGAARDYLGALVAQRIGLKKKIDSMARLVGELHESTFPSDSLLALLIDIGCISTHPKEPGKYAVAGWMRDVTALRNELVHKRPYGSKFAERYGWVIPKQKDVGIYRYFRPLYLNGNAEQDVLDVVLHHYAQCTSLFHKAANAAGNDASMLRITDEDVLASKSL